jgi:hypothetical protein
VTDLDDLLMNGGHLFIETFGGHGQNFLELPKANQIRKALKGYKLIFYDERSVGPKSQDAVVVQALAKKCCSARSPCGS